MEERRSILAPHDTVQQILYALLVPTLPYCIWKVYLKTGDDMFLVTCFFWWMVCTIYTISWIAQWAYRCRNRS